MTETGAPMKHSTDRMSEEERIAISSHIEEKFGIRMPEMKKTLLMGRLSKRLRVLGIGNYGEYFQYIQSPEGMTHEYPVFADLVSTHETSFFREPTHYEFLMETALPELYRELKGTGNELHILSAACSTGEEAYSAAFSIEEFNRNRTGSSLPYRITGTDMSLKVVQTAARGIYNDNRIQKIPQHIARRYLMRSRDKNSPLYRVIPEIRSRMEFIVMNLMDKSYSALKNYHIIFCRNVLIYFEKETQAMVTSRLCSHLETDGYLFIGHSETLIGLDLPLRAVAPSVYRKTG